MAADIIAVGMNGSPWLFATDANLNPVTISGTMPTAAVYTTDISPDKRWLAVNMSFTTIMLYDLASGAPVYARTLVTGLTNIQSICFSPDGTKLLVISVSTSPGAFVYDCATGASLTAPVIPSVGTYQPNHADWSVDDQIAITGNASPFLRLYNGTTMAAIAAPATLPTSTPDAVKYSPNGTHLALYTLPPMIYRRDTMAVLTNPTISPAFDGGQPGRDSIMDWNADGTKITFAAYNASPFVVTWWRNDNTLTKDSNLSGSTTPDAKPQAISYDRSGRYLFMSSGTSFTPLKFAVGNPSTFLGSGSAKTQALLSMSNSVGSINTTVKTLLGYNYNGAVVNFFDVFNGVEQEVILPDPTLLARDTTTIDFDKTGNFVAVVDLLVNKLLIYDISSGTPVQTQALDPGSMAGQKNVCEWSDDGKWLLVAGNSTGNVPIAYLFNTTTWVAAVLTGGPTGTGNSWQGGAFNRQSTRLLLADYSTNSIYVWTIATGGATYSTSLTPTPSLPLTQMEFTDDGTLLAVGRNGAPSVSLFNVTSTGTVFTQISLGAASWSANARDIAWNHANTKLAVMGSVSPFIKVLNYPALTFSDVGTALAGSSFSVDFSLDDTEILTSVMSGTSPPIQVYNASTLALKTTRTRWTSPTSGAHFIKQVLQTAKPSVPGSGLRPIINMMQ